MSDPTAVPVTPPVWSAQSTVDPNSGAPIQPAAIQPAQTAPAQETFADMWQNAPDSTAPVRTWVDPSMRNTPQGQFVDAWYDTPTTPGAADASAAGAGTGTGITGAPAATPLTGLIDSLNTGNATEATAAAQRNAVLARYGVSGQPFDGGPGGNSGDAGDAGTASAGDAGNGDGGTGGVGDGSGSGGGSASA